MSLEDKFEANIGDLVVFSKDDDVDVVGYVSGYSSKKVMLSNRGYYVSNDPFKKRDSSPCGVFPFGEETYRVRLSEWNAYKILVPAPNSEK